MDKLKLFMFWKTEYNRTLIVLFLQFSFPAGVN